MTPALPATLLVCIGAGGGALLRKSWAGRARSHAIPRAAGLLLIAGGFLVASATIGSALGVAFAAVCEPVGALLMVLGGATRRVARTGRRAQLAPEPLVGPSRAWRGWLKAALAGPIGMLAALSLSFCYATWAPGAVQTRLLIAALLVPALWGAAMTWTLADQRIVRSTAVLSGTIVAGFGLALIRGVA
jgi:hypothetical protein